jgi:ribosomal protein S18 acetylase RimI-like enzyme
VGVTLAELTNDESAAYLSSLWPRYREELVLAGASPTEADANVERNQQTVCPEGVISPGQRIFRVMYDGHHIGNLWLCERAPGDWFVYDIEVFEDYRGQGLGRASMHAAEEFAKAHGATKLGLSVFGFNTTARALYESLGYTIVAMGMTKPLE